MSFEVRKYLLNGWRPCCSKCGQLVEKHEWWFSRRKTPKEQQKTYMDGGYIRHCIMCRFNVGGHLRDIINSTLDVYYEMLITDDRIITYQRAKQIADTAKGITVI